ncbi:recombinase family protein, partial [Rhodovulum sulfidophilum]|nr:recombinase family protein [Rhodovulum sulfidophilum]
MVLHPGLADVYAAKISDLAAALNDPESRPEAVEILRGLIEKIVLSPDADAANGHVIELYGELGSILSLCGNGMCQNANAR